MKPDMVPECRTVQADRSKILDAPPSCIEFAPIHSGHFVVGTYSLNSEVHEDVAREKHHDQVADIAEQSRSGSLILFKLDGFHMYALTYAVQRHDDVFHFCHL